MVASLDHATIGALRVLGTPFKLSDTPAAIRTPPPRLGEHTRRILTHDLARTETDIASLQSAGVI
jgi:crotonobetainyl-CoA:carnitine CoA-transferase CaiB-like acyl-CoA transferase